MKYRLLALDLDGTLLNSQKEITPEVRKALAWAKERGVYVVLSTGRIVGEAAEFARELPCEDLMVTAGGTRNRRKGGRGGAEPTGARDDLRRQ